MDYIVGGKDKRYYRIKKKKGVKKIVLSKPMFLEYHVKTMMTQRRILI